MLISKVNRFTLILLGLLLLVPGGAALQAAEREPLRVLVVRGLWHEQYRLDEALARAGVAAADDCWVWDTTGSGWPGPGDQGGGGLIDFPAAAELADYDVVIVANANARCFGSQAEILADYVRNGGSVLFLGGRFAFGKQYRNSPFAEMMPVEFPGRGPWGSDLKNVAGGLDLTPGDGAPPGRLAALPWDRRPMLAWYHSVLPKPGAKVWLTAGKKPLLVTGVYGKGRVAVFAGTVMGDPPEGRVAFWEWQGWPALVATAVRWLGETPRRPGPAPLSEQAVRELIQSGEPEKTALGLSLLGARHTGDALTVLQQFYKTGKPQAVAKTAEPGVMDLLEGTRGTSMEPGLQRDASAGAMAIRLGALAGLGRLGGAEALAVLHEAVAAHRDAGAPRPTDYAEFLTDANRLYQQALVSALCCGDEAAAAPVVDAMLENLYIVARARGEGNKAPQRLKKARSMVPGEFAHQRDLCRQLSAVPDSVRLALARRIAAEKDRRVTPLALAVFGGRPVSAAAAAILKTSAVPAVAALGEGGD